MRPLEQVIKALCEKRNGRLPDLENPRGYNDKIQWLKLHDQRKEHIAACDKYAVRDWVAEKAGDVLIPARMGVVPEFIPGVVKCTHDSGGVRFADDERGLERAHLDLMHRLSKPYGVEKGEWAYQFVPPRLMTEKALDGPVVDYKFHCTHGKVRWVQVIWDRARGAREAIFMPDGALTSLHMDDKMRHCPERSVYPGSEAWAALTALAEKLAEGWRYVRVDLYWSAGKAWFGELTFWPRAGCYGSKDEPIFGELMEIDLSEKLEPIVK